MDSKILRHVRIADWAFADAYFALVPKDKSKGAGKGRKTTHVTAELWPGAWETYLAMLGDRERALAEIHVDYLQTRAECQRHGDPSDLAEFKSRVSKRMRAAGLRASDARQYIALKWADISDPTGPRLKMRD